MFLKFRPGKSKCGSSTSIFYVSVGFVFNSCTELLCVIDNMELDVVDFNVFFHVYTEHFEGAIKIIKEGEEIFSMQQRFLQNVNFCQISEYMHRCLLTEAVISECFACQITCLPPQCLPSLLSIYK